MSHLPLFPDLSEAEESGRPASLPISELRLSRPVRNQVEMVMQELDALIGPGHLPAGAGRRNRLAPGREQSA